MLAVLVNVLSISHKVNAWVPFRDLQIFVWILTPLSNDNLSEWFQYKPSSLLLLFWFQYSIHKPKQEETISVSVSDGAAFKRHKMKDIANNSSFLSSCSWIEASLLKSMGGTNALSKGVKRIRAAMLSGLRRSFLESVIYANAAGRSCS